MLTPRHTRKCHVRRFRVKEHFWNSHCVRKWFPRLLRRERRASIFNFKRRNVRGISSHSGWRHVKAAERNSVLMRFLSRAFTLRHGTNGTCATSFGLCARALDIFRIDIFTLSLRRATNWQPVYSRMSNFRLARQMEISFWTLDIRCALPMVYRKLQILAISCKFSYDLSSCTFVYNVQKYCDRV